MKILLICGSLRKESYNLKLLKNFASLSPSWSETSIYRINDIPFFNEDVEVEGFPAPVNDLAKNILDARMIVFGLPEYNYSIPGVLKNAIDWLSRHKDQPLQGKLAAIMGASMGRLGTARAQYHLRQVGVFVDLRFLNRPEVMVSDAHNKFDENGVLTDQSTVDQLKKLWVAIEQVISRD